MLALVWLKALPVFAAEPSKEPVGAFVAKLNEASLQLSSGTPEDARKKGRELFAWAFDLPIMAKFALGEAWEQADSAQRKRLLEAFEQDAVSAYLREMRMPGVTLEFVGHRSAEHGHRFAASRRSMPNAPDEIWMWELHPENESWRVVDLHIDGKSVRGVARKDYSSVFADSNGDIEAVIDFMRKRAAKSVDVE